MGSFPLVVLTRKRDKLTDAEPSKLRPLALTSIYTYPRIIGGNRHRGSYPRMIGGHDSICPRLIGGKYRPALRMNGGKTSVSPA